MKKLTKISAKRTAVQSTFQRPVKCAPPRWSTLPSSTRLRTTVQCRSAASQTPRTAVRRLQLEFSSATESLKQNRHTATFRWSRWRSSSRRRRWWRSARFTTGSWSSFRITGRTSKGEKILLNLFITILDGKTQFDTVCRLTTVSSKFHDRQTNREKVATGLFTMMQETCLKMAAISEGRNDSNVLKR